MILLTLAIIAGTYFICRAIADQPTAVIDPRYQEYLDDRYSDDEDDEPQTTSGRWIVRPKE